MARVLIAGCGYVGTALGRLLADDGDEVWGLRRAPAGLPAPIRPLAADLTDPATLTGLPPELDAVVYAASATSFSDAAYTATYVHGVENLIAALRSAGPDPERFLFVSSTGVYGQSDGSWVDETSPTEPHGFSGRRLLEGERLALNAAAVPGVVRCGGIYGPGRTRLVDSVRHGEARLSPGPPQYTNRIHRDDCAGVLRHLLRAAAPPAVLLGVDHDPAGRNVVLRWLAAELGVPAPPSAATEDAPERRGTNKRCSNAALLRTGYVFRYPTFREGYGAMLARGRQ